MNDTGLVLAAKADLRSVAKVRRARAFAAAGETAALQLADHGMASLAGARPQVVSAYLAMGDELDPMALAQRLVAAGWQLALPVVVAKGRPLLFRLWQPGSPTVAAGFGTREPPAGNSEVTPDHLLVPLLAFDAQGWRLGYGGGYYDRTLKVLRAGKPVLAIGIGYDEQEVDAVPHLDYDERLDGVLTPSGLRRFTDRL